MALALSRSSCAGLGRAARALVPPKAAIRAASVHGAVPRGTGPRRGNVLFSSKPWAQGSRLGWPARAVAPAADVLSSSDDEAHDDTIELDIKVAGMSSSGCSDRVASALKELAGVKAVSVDLSAELATVEVAAVSLMDALDMLPGLCETVQGLGFEAQPHIEHSC